MELNNRLLTTFKDFLNDINKINNDIGKESLEYYQEILDLEELPNIKENDKLLSFLNTIDKHSKKISERDEKVINHINLIKINIKNLWIDLDDINKNNIWKYLQTISLIKLNIESNNELKNILSGNEDIENSNKENLKALKKMKLLKNGLNKTNKDIEEHKEETEDTEDMDNNLDNILNNTGIGNLAKEIADSFDLDDESNIMDPANLMSLFTKINNTVQDKIKSGDLDLNKVTNELPSIYSNIQNNELFNNINKKIDTKEIDTKEIDTKEIDTKEVDTKEVDTKEVDTKEVDIKTKKTTNKKTTNKKTTNKKTKTKKN